MKNAAPSNQLMMGCVEPYTAVTTGDAALPAAVVNAYTELESTFRVERRSHPPYASVQACRWDIVREVGLKNQEQWKEWCRDGQRAALRSAHHIRDNLVWWRH
jgi:hypothetical protein